MNVNLEMPESKEAISGEIRISIKDLDLYYGDFQALRKITLDIPKNAITAISGHPVAVSPLSCVSLTA